MSGSGQDRLQAILHETKRYVMLTRALIIRRMLHGGAFLDAKQRREYEQQQQEIQERLDLTSAQLEGELDQMEQRHRDQFATAPHAPPMVPSSLPLNGPMAKQLHYCINKHCKHKFYSYFQGCTACPACGSKTMHMSLE